MSPRVRAAVRGTHANIAAALIALAAVQESSYRIKAASKKEP